jgi:hypothetical protein
MITISPSVTVIPSVLTVIPHACDRFTGRGMYVYVSIYIYANMYVRACLRMCMYACECAKMDM